MVTTGSALILAVVHVRQAFETLPQPARTASRPTNRVPHGWCPAPGNVRQHGQQWDERAKGSVVEK